MRRLDSTATALVAALALPACLAAEIGEPVDEGEGEDEIFVVEGPRLQGPRLQGPRLQGPRLQGTDLQGPRLQGPRLQGVDLTGRTYLGVDPYSFHDSDGRARGSIRFSSGLLYDDVWYAAHGHYHRDYVGTGERFELEFSGTDSDPGTVSVYASIEGYRSEDGIRFYDIRVHDDAGNAYNVCDDGEQAVLMYGEWSSGGDWRGGGVTLGCESGAITKCMRAPWHYRPWLASVSDGNGNTISYRDLHQSCTRGVRADYRGNGVSHTLDGTWVDLADQLAATPNTWSSSSIGFDVEAVFGPRIGALAVHKWRHEQLAADGITLSDATLVITPEAGSILGALCQSPNFLAKSIYDSEWECMQDVRRKICVDGTPSGQGWAWDQDFCSGALIYVSSGRVQSPDTYSDESCSDLGWSTYYGAGSAECGESSASGLSCQSRVGWFAAAETCESMGARLCSASELQQGAGNYSGCYDRYDSIWARDACTLPDGSPGRKVVHGNASNGIYRNEVVCVAPIELEAYGRDNSVRCCADQAITIMTRPR